MNVKDHDEDAPDAGAVLRFPLSRTTPAGSAGGFKDLGIGAVAHHLGLSKDQMSGHWCSRCHGIWFGYALEVECPQCGYRHG
ncbi:MAG TPA: hypothetical protein VMU78_08085 [Methylocella sp.]|nr:hypothetical protein [Methylocella sp.]